MAKYKEYMQFLQNYKNQKGNYINDNIQINFLNMYIKNKKCLAGEFNEVPSVSLATSTQNTTTTTTSIKEIKNLPAPTITSSSRFNGDDKLNIEEKKPEKTEIFIEINHPIKEKAKIYQQQNDIKVDQIDGSHVKNTLKIFNQNEINNTNNKIKKQQNYSTISELSKQFEMKQNKNSVNYNTKTIPKNNINKTNQNTNDIDPILKRKIGNAALRDWYNGYNEQANNYVNSLPKHMVKKNDTNIQNIIQSIS